MTSGFRRSEIEAILPHRDPFLFVDEILEIVPGKRIVGLVRVRQAGRFLGKDPAGNPYFPASLLTESMAQVGAILVLLQSANRGRTIYFRSIDRARFRRAIPAGATVRVEGLVKRLRGRMGTLEMKAYVGQELAARGTMGFALSD